MSPKRASAVAFVALLLLALAVPALGARKAPTPTRQVNTAFALLIRDTNALPKRVVSKRSKTSLVRLAKRAHKSSKRKPCTSIKTLRSYKRGLRRVKKPGKKQRRPVAGTPRGRLQSRVLSANVALLALPRTKGCGGAKKAPVGEANKRVLTSTEKQLKMRVQLPPAQFIAHRVNNTDFMEMTMEGLAQAGDLGSPGLPQVTNFFAIPEGANVSLQVGNVQGYTLSDVELYPKQPSPVDLKLPPGAPSQDTFLEKPFQIDRAEYRQNKLFPSSPGDAGAMGAMRDLRVGGVSTAGGQYNPKTNKLKVFTSIDVTVNFGGDNKGTFGTSELLSPWNRAFADDYATLANFQIATDRLREFRSRFCGEELLIITSPALRPAANTLQSQRVAQGYSTSVREVGSGSGQIGTTNAQIRDFIRGRLTGDCLVKPSYVILFGNTAHVPTFLVPCSPGGDPTACNIASDLDYSLNGIGTDLFADVQLGRLPAPTLDAANALVTKLNTYATTNPAPPGDDFLRRGAVTSYFQPAMICVLNEGATGTPNCNGDAPPVTGHWEIDYTNRQDTRGFTITAERIRNAMAADSYQVDRLYTTDDEDVIPETYFNGTPIPAHLRRPTFGWDADTTDFFNTYNEGRFVILHRDHGWPDGWAEPTLHSGHVPLFSNGSQQPVVFGINCSSAAFDTPDHPSFVELQVLRPDGGAIAGFGDTRVSPSFPNNHMALGFFDAMFPSTVPDYGGPETRRLGDILVRGKQYMATQEGFNWHGAGDTYAEHYLYHLLGDPTMQMWSDPPVRFDPSRFKGVIRDIREIRPPRPGDPPFFVRVELESPIANGTVVTLYSSGNPVGKGIIQNGIANVIPEVEVSTRELSFSLQQDGAFPAGEPVESDQAPAPQPVSTSLTLTGPQDISATGPPGKFSGDLDPDFAGAQIRVVYTPESNNNPKDPRQPITHTVTANAQGNWEDEVSISYNNDFRSWKAQAFFDGDSAHNPSQSNTASFVVGD